MDPPSLAIWPCPEVRVTTEAVTKARVSADGNINPRSAFFSWHSRRYTSLVECLSHLLKRRRNHTGQANCSGLTEILFGGGLAGCFIASLRHASLVVGQDGVKLLLDVFGHRRYSVNALDVAYIEPLDSACSRDSSHLQRLPNCGRPRADRVVLRTTVPRALEHVVDSQVAHAAFAK